MFNRKEYEKALIDFDTNTCELAKYLGIGETAMYNKINGKTEFKHGEICKLIKLWGKKTVDNIFFGE